MVKYLITAAASFAILAGSAYADDTRAAGALQVYDSQRTLVGQLIAGDEVAVSYHGNVYSLLFYKSDPVPNFELYFSGPDCTGQRYVQSQIPNELSLLQPAFYQAVAGAGAAAKTVWTADNSAPQTTPINSEWFENFNAGNNQFTPICQNLGAGTSVLAQPAIQLQISISPPLWVTNIGRPCNAQ
jgi:hypothetical protein